MKAGLRLNKRAAKLVEAVRAGAATSRDIAVLFGSTTALIAPELNRLAAAGHIVRDGTEKPLKAYRPRLRWRASK